MIRPLAVCTGTGRSRKELIRSLLLQKDQLFGVHLASALTNLISSELVSVRSLFLGMHLEIEAQEPYLRSANSFCLPDICKNDNAVSVFQSNKISKAHPLAASLILLFSSLHFSSLLFCSLLLSDVIRSCEQNKLAAGHDLLILFTWHDFSILFTSSQVLAGFSFTELLI